MSSGAISLSMACCSIRKTAKSLISSVDRKICASRSCAPSLRRTDGAHDLLAQIFLSTDEIKDLAVFRIEQQAIDSEIAPLDILFRFFRVGHLVRVTAVGVKAIGPEGGNFDGVHSSSGFVHLIRREIRSRGRVTG